MMQRYLNDSGFQRGSWQYREKILLSGVLMSLLLLNSRYIHHGHATATLKPVTIFVWLIVAAGFALLMFPVVIWLCQRFPLAQAPVKHGLLHAGITIGVAIAHLFVFRDVTWLFCSYCPDAFPTIYAAIGSFFSNQILPALCIYPTMLGSHYAVLFWHSSRERDRQTRRLQDALQRAELRSLNAQINPHFLFNALQMISALVHNDANRADQAIVQLSNLLRLTLRQTDVEVIALEQELAMLKLYLDIMQIRFENALQIKFDIDPKTLNAEVPYLLMQPLVENAIEYGANPDDDSRNIRISAAISGRKLQLDIADNGRGFSLEEANWQDAGVGISNTIKRLEQLYGARHQFRISDGITGGANVTISIPFRIHKNAAAVNPSKE